MTTENDNFFGTSPPNWSVELHSKTSVKEVIINHGDVVDGIAFVIVDSNDKTITKLSGNYMGHPSQITLKKDEYITEISGTRGKYRSHPAIGLLTIHTNLHPSGYGPYGKAKNFKDVTRFQSSVSSKDNWISEIFGRQGTYLESIGVSLRKEDVSYGCASPSNWSVVLDSKTNVKEVIVNHGSIVDGIAFVIADSTGKTTTKSSGTYMGYPSKITLNKDEYITQISGAQGQYCSRPAIGLLTIHTNLHPSGYGPYGKAENFINVTRFSSSILTHDDWIADIFGRQGTYLESIGVSLRQGDDIFYGGDACPPNWNVVLDSKTSVKEVIINHGSIVDGIAFVIANSSGKTTTKFSGTYKGRPSKITFKKDEYITQISGTRGHYHSHAAIGLLTIHTNLHPSGYGPYGKAENFINVTRFSSSVSSHDDWIIEFFGRQGTYLEYIEISLTKQKNQNDSSNNPPPSKDNKSEQKRGSIAFFSTYRPPVALDIYSAKFPPTSAKDEALMTDGMAYNYNGQVIPPSALKAMLKRPLLAPHGTEFDVDSGRLSGLIFVSERTNGLETLHIALTYQQHPPKVFNFAQVYETYDSVRLEDSGCFAGDSLIYVSTMEPFPLPHQPWTAVYITNLKTGKTGCLTLRGRSDISPSVSPDGKRIAVASFQNKAGWDGEIEDLKTSIYIIDIENPSNRKLVVNDGGWPTWGSENVLFFHRNIEKFKIEKRWGVFRVDLRVGSTSETRVTPENISAMTPSAIDEQRVVVATVRRRFTFDDENERKEDQYRHIEIFGVNKSQHIEITRKIKPMADHFNPFVVDKNRIGYHRCHTEKVNAYNILDKEFHKLQSPDKEIGLFRVSGVFPTISDCGTKLAFVDNEFKAVWLADNTGLHMVYKRNDHPNNLFSPVWSRGKDVLYICVGPSFSVNKTVQIVAISNVSGPNRQSRCLTHSGCNSAFPATNADGTRLVYRSTKDGSKNLYIMEDPVRGEFDGGKVTRLTQGNWTDTHCQWSPTQDWIVFASNRANPTAKRPQDLPDPGYFGVYLVKANDKNVVIKVIDSGTISGSRGLLFPGHVSHPFFSPDGKSLVVAADLAAVSCDPVSLPLFVHSVRPYGDIFVLDIDVQDIRKNENVKKYTRFTHSKYENSTASWTTASTEDLHAKWKVRIAGNDEAKNYQPKCPYVHENGAESLHMTGHLCIGNQRCC